jgi:hypothetical protein
VFLGAFLHSGVGELLFWGYFAKKYKPFGESRIQFGVSENFWQNLIDLAKVIPFGKTPIQSGKTLYNLAKVGSSPNCIGFCRKV